jgi:hypothetical protein
MTWENGTQGWKGGHHMDVPSHTYGWARWLSHTR